MCKMLAYNNLPRNSIAFNFEKIKAELKSGAGKGGRTLDLLVGNETLYH